MQLIRRFMALPALLALLGCSHRSNAEHVVLYLNWFPEVEHAGYYDALIHGYYLEAGLDVEIRPGGAGSQPCRQISPSRAEFGVDNADAILMNRSIGVLVVALMRRSRILLFASWSMPAREFGIFESSRARRWRSRRAPYSEYLSRHGLLEGVRVVNYSGNIGQFLQDQAVAQQGYVFSEPVRRCRRCESRFAADLEARLQSICLCARGRRSVRQEPPGPGRQDGQGQRAGMAPFCGRSERGESQAG